MCGDDLEPLPAVMPATDDFPWHLGVSDAHNHVGERRLTASQIPGMRARCLAIMATRCQDQELVASIASKYKLSAACDLSRDGLTTVVPEIGRAHV